MFTQKKMKQAARNNFLQSLGRSVGITFLVWLPLLFCGFVILIFLFLFAIPIFNYVTGNSISYAADLAIVIIPLAAGGFITLIYSLTTAVAEVGFARFYLKRRGMRTPTVGEAYAPFNEGSALNIISARFSTNIIVGCGFLLFFIPGILLFLKYAMVPFVLAADGSITGRKAREYSGKLMKGHFGEFFLLYLSFFGWIIFSSLTAGILLFVYVLPFLEASLAEFYSCRRAELIAEGALSPSELPSFGSDWYSPHNPNGPFAAAPPTGNI